MFASLPPCTPKNECFLDYSSYVYSTIFILLHAVCIIRQSPVLNDEIVNAGCSYAMKPA